MSRAITVQTAAALDAPHVTRFALVELGLDGGTEYLVGLPHDIDWNGHTWQAALGLGTIDVVVETDTEQPGLSFTLSAVPASAIALGLTEDVQGRPVIVRLAAIDSGGVLRVDENVWQGQLDVMSIDDGASSAVVRVTAEHQLIAWEEPAGLRFNDQDQQRLNPGDPYFQYQASLVNATLVWPSRAAQEVG